MALNRSYSASTQHFQTVVANDAMVKEFTKRFGEKIDFFGMVMKTQWNGRFQQQFLYFIKRDLDFCQLK